MPDKCLIPKYRRDSYENVRDNWVVEDVRSRRRSQSKPSKRSERSEDRKESGKEGRKRHNNEDIRTLIVGGKRMKYDDSPESETRRHGSDSTKKVTSEKGGSKGSTPKGDNSKKQLRDNSTYTRKENNNRCDDSGDSMKNDKKLDRQQ